MSSFLRIVVSMSLLACCCAIAHAADTDQDLIAEAYAMPAELLRIRDGRALNLRCSGEGEPVIVLESGGNSDSSTWHRVQPQLASLTRVCAYDRAGYGFSDEGPQPRTLEADVADLHALLEAAGIPLPALLVGHSLGSNIVRKYAQLHPQQVAGMVLVDPPEQGSDDKMPEAWQSQTASMLAQRDAILGTCEDAAAADDFEKIRQRCLREPPTWMSERVASAMQRNKAKPSYWRTLRSELAHNIEVFSLPVPLDESYGSIPLVLLRPTEQDVDAPAEVLEVIDAARKQTHARILAASTQSIEIEVPDTSHDIQLDRPEAVIAAVRRLLVEARRADAPPASEGD